jgi:membrane glycosyltransferase
MEENLGRIGTILTKFMLVQMIATTFETDKDITIEGSNYLQENILFLFQMEKNGPIIFNKVSQTMGFINTKQEDDQLRLL